MGNPVFGKVRLGVNRNSYMLYIFRSPADCSDALSPPTEVDVSMTAHRLADQRTLRCVSQQPCL